MAQGRPVHFRVSACSSTANMVGSNSAAGILSLLEDDDLDIQDYALSQLDTHVSQFWPEISDSITKIEIIYETSSSSALKNLAALLLSKVYFHLGDLDESLNFALNAGDLFQVDNVDGDQYVETVISQCIDKYIVLRSEDEASSAVASTSKAPPSNEGRMQAIVESMLNRCLRDKEYKQALGIALETRRLDVLQNILSSKEVVASDPALLSYVLQSTMTLLTKLDLRNQVLNLLIGLFYQTEPLPDYFSMTQCFVYLNDSAQAANMMKELLKDEQSEEKVLIALQVAFDLADTATQEFLGAVRESLKPAEGATNTDFTNRIISILTGKESIRLYLEFLYKNNKADLAILKSSKDVLEGRNSVFHSAVTFANAFAHAGTTSDLFLRENLDWLGKASNWSKFSATAALGVIHKGNLDQAMEILQPYLPAPGGTDGSTSVFSEGGSLYALGLVNANHGVGVLDYLKEAVKNNQNETILHGACLGLGVAGMATGNEEIYDELRNALYNDNAVAGEAAGYAMGLVMLGTASSKALDEMLQYAHETQHEKIIRGLAIGMAFLMYGKQEEADGLIETLGADKDPILRYGGIYTIAMAYAGTGNSKAIRKLLHVAVSDTNDDVRRAAVIALGFLLFRNPSQVPRIVQLLSESYNPNVRFGATLALGISCAGTGLEEAVALLEPMTKDSVDFVRQGASVSLAMILIQQNETLNPKVKTTRELFAKIVKDKHEDAMAKLGATMAQGLLDAGGRNVTISMQSKSGSSNMPAIVGLALFTQFWYWFPLAHCASLAFTPTAIIGVDKDLKLPKFEFTSNVKPSLFAYQPQTKPPQKETVEKVATAVLSTTAKTSARAKTKEKEKSGDAMDTDETPASATESKPKEAEAMQTDETPAEDETSTEKDDKTDAKKARKAEPKSENLPNLSRVVPAQLPYITFPSESRYQPVRPVVPERMTVNATKKATKSSASPAAAAIMAQSSSVSSRAGGGIFVMRDTKPSESAEFIDLEAVQPIDNGPAAPAAATANSQADSGLNVDMQAPIADAPPSFDYPFGQD